MSFLGERGCNGNPFSSRLIADFVRLCVEDLGGLEAAAARISVHKSTLSRYCAPYDGPTVPYDVIVALAAESGRRGLQYETQRYLGMGDDASILARRLADVARIAQAPMDGADDDGKFAPPESARR